MKLYLDSSVLVAAFAPEKFSQRAMDLLGNAFEVVVSELTVTEACSLPITLGVVGNEQVCGLSSSWRSH